MKEDGKKELIGEYGRGDLIGVVRWREEFQTNIFQEESYRRVPFSSNGSRTF